MIYTAASLPGTNSLGSLQEGFWRHSKTGLASNTVLEIVDDVTAGSGKALMAKVISDGTNNTYRAEVAGSNSNQAPPGQIGKLKDGDEVWIGFSLMLKNGSQSPLDFNSVNFQIIQTSGAWIGENSFAGPTVHLTQKNGRFFVEQAWDSNLNSTDKNVISHINLVDVGEVVLEKWTRFVVHIIFQSTQPGVTEFWRDNKLVYRNTTNPNNYNQSNSTAGMKFGSYIPSWKSPDRFPQAGVYVAWAFDNIIIGGSDSSLSEMMSPASNPVPKPLPGYTF